MNITLRIDDIMSYLADMGWERDQSNWQNASVWRTADDYEVVVPLRDGLGDGHRRIREILHCLSTVEDRHADDIASDIAQPNLDRQLFHTFPVGHRSGYTPLPSGAQALQGIRGILAAATRTVLQGPHFAFSGRPPGGVGEMLRAAELGPTRAGSYVYEVRIAIDAATRVAGGETVDGRAVLVQMLEAVTAVQAAVHLNELGAFDETVTAGVSADLCRALSDLSGLGHEEPFHIAFRWARSQPMDVQSQIVAFPERSGRLLMGAADRLRELNASGRAAVTGIVEGLHDDAGGEDRWRMRIRGELHTASLHRSRRAVWVRLADQVEYDRAIEAHRERRVITVVGDLSSTTGRVELVPERGFAL